MNRFNHCLNNAALKNEIIKVDGGIQRVRRNINKYHLTDHAHRPELPMCVRNYLCWIGSC